MINGQLDYKGKLLCESSSFAVNEAFKMLRTNLFYTSKGETCPVYGVTSTFAHSGKSILVSNLAVAFSQLEKRVLLIDCDLRSSVIHNIFELENEAGMSELLAGTKEKIGKFVQKTQYPNLSVITAGGMPPNPAELLAGKRMNEFIECMKQHFDVIFIDLPPVGIVTDAVVINELVTGYLYVVRSRVDDTKSLRNGLSVMEQMDAKIIGLVLNDVDPKSGNYGKYGKKYGYGYENTGREQKESK